MLEALITRRRLAVTALLLLAAPAVSAQPSAVGAPNGVYLELLGNGGLYSVNYDRKLTDRVSIRLGVGAWTSESFFGGKTTLRTVPLTVNVLGGRGNHRLEAAAGVLVGRRTRGSVYSSSSETSGFLSLTGTLGYRYQRQRGFLFRTGFTPFFGLGDEETAYPDKGFLPSIGVSFGFGF
jgi:hypothetical protein